MRFSREFELSMKMHCIICQESTEPLFQKHGYWIERCVACGHQMANVITAPDHIERIYGDHYFHQEYNSKRNGEESDRCGSAGYPDYLAEADLLTAHGQRYGSLLTRYMQPGTVLDVGAAAGFLLQGLANCGWRGTGLEPNPRMAAHGRDVFGLEMAVGDLEYFVPTDRYDLITMLQVIAHFHDLQQALQQAAALTKPSGFWLIESWNRASLPARLLGSAWHEYSPPSVLHWFSPKDLTKLADQHGFQLVARGRPQKWLSAAHAKSLLSYKLQGMPGYRLFHHTVALIPDGLVLPYPTLDLVWMLFQKRT